MQHNTFFVETSFKRARGREGRASRSTVKRARASRRLSQCSDLPPDVYVKLRIGRDGAPRTGALHLSPSHQVSPQHATLLKITRPSRSRQETESFQIWYYDGEKFQEIMRCRRPARRKSQAGVRANWCLPIAMNGSSWAGPRALRSWLNMRSQACYEVRSLVGRAGRRDGLQITAHSIHQARGMETVLRDRSTRRPHAKTRRVQHPCKHHRVGGDRGDAARGRAAGVRHPPARRAV